MFGALCLICSPFEPMKEIVIPRLRKNHEFATYAPRILVKRQPPNIRSYRQLVRYVYVKHTTFDQSIVKSCRLTLLMQSTVFLHDTIFFIFSSIMSLFCLLKSFDFLYNGFRLMRYNYSGMISPNIVVESTIDDDEDHGIHAPSLLHTSISTATLSATTFMTDDPLMPPIETKRKFSFPIILQSTSLLSDVNAASARRRLSNVSDVVTRKLSNTIGWKIQSAAPTPELVAQILLQGKCLCGQYIRFRLKRAGLFTKKLGLQRLRSIIGTPSAHIVREVYPVISYVSIKSMFLMVSMTFVCHYSFYLIVCLLIRFRRKNPDQR